mgnify:FL=1
MVRLAGFEHNHIVRRRFLPGHPTDIGDTHRHSLTNDRHRHGSRKYLLRLPWSEDLQDVRAELERESEEGLEWKHILIVTPVDIVDELSFLFPIGVIFDCYTPF